MPDLPAVQLVDRRALYRDALRSLLQAEGVRVAASSSQATDAAADYVAARPEVVLVDIENDDGTADTAIIDALRAIDHDARILVLTNETDLRSIADALRAGACGYLIKNDDIGELVRAIDAVRRGGGYFSPEIAGRVATLARQSNPVAGTIEGLSKRERDVLLLLVDGHENSAIAELLGISPKTAKNHVSNILQKLDVDNRVQAAVIAVRSGLGPAGDS